MNNTLLAKYIFRETSTNENVKVEKWLALSAQNRRELELLQEKINLSTQRYHPNTFDSEIAYQKLHTQMHVVAPSHRLKRFYPATAIILLLFGCGLFYFFRDQSPNIITAQCLPDQTLEILLPDSSIVTLAGSARLTYPAQFKSTNRQVSMSGKVYFQVHRDTANPFIIQTPSISITVLGTSFQVEASQQQAEVLVHSGKVAVNTPNHESSKILTAGMSSEWSSHIPQLITDTSFQVNKLSWKTKIIKFKETPLAEVIEILNDHYKVKILLPTNHQTLKLTATFDNQTLAEVLEIINQTLNLQLTVSQQ